MLTVAEGLQTLTKLGVVNNLPSSLPKTIEERKALEDQANKFFGELTPQEKVDYADRLVADRPESEGFKDLRRQVWETNHAEISRHLHNYVIQNRRPPTRNQLAELTGLSRQTITLHLREFNETETYRHERKAFRLLSNRVLSKMYDVALDGNVRAARLFFEMTGQMPSQKTRNYFIQVNNVRVNESVIKSLPPDAVKQIEDIILNNQPITTKENGNT